MSDDGRPMLVVLAQLAVPNEHLSALNAAIDDVVRPSRAEVGCLSYDFTMDRADATVVHISEVWADTEALDLHMATDHYRSFAARLRELPVERAEVRKFSASPL